VVDIDYVKISIFPDFVG